MLRDVETIALAVQLWAQACETAVLCSRQPPQLRLVLNHTYTLLLSCHKFCAQFVAGWAVSSDGGHVARLLDTAHGVAVAVMALLPAAPIAAKHAARGACTSTQSAGSSACGSSTAGSGATGAAAGSTATMAGSSHAHWLVLAARCLDVHGQLVVRAMKSARLAAAPAATARAARAEPVDAADAAAAALARPALAHVPGALLLLGDGLQTAAADGRLRAQGTGPGHGAASRRERDSTSNRSLLMVGLSASQSQARDAPDLRTSTVNLLSLALAAQRQACSMTKHVTPALRDQEAAVTAGAHVVLPLLQHLQQVRRLAAAVCAVLPLPSLACSNPSCSNLSGLCEAHLVWRKESCAHCSGAAHFCSKQCLREAWPHHKSASCALQAATAQAEALP
jgi:hypothetical protein